jgi:hypothetical protein
MEAEVSTVVEPMAASNVASGVPTNRNPPTTAIRQSAASRTLPPPATPASTRSLQAGAAATPLFKNHGSDDEDLPPFPESPPPELTSSSRRGDPKPGALDRASAFAAAANPGGGKAMTTAAANDSAARIAQLKLQRDTLRSKRISSTATSARDQQVGTCAAPMPPTLRFPPSVPPRCRYVYQRPLRKVSLTLCSSTRLRCRCRCRLRKEVLLRLVPSTLHHAISRQPRRHPRFLRRTNQQSNNHRLPL